MPTGFTTVYAVMLTDASGNLINNATIYFQPCNNQGVPISAKASGSGHLTVRPVSVQVVDGAFSVTLADTTLTSPVNLSYLVTVVDNVSQKQMLGPGYLIQPSGPTWSFDGFVPNMPALVTTNYFGLRENPTASKAFTGTPIPSSAVLDFYGGFGRLQSFGVDATHYGAVQLYSNNSTSTNDTLLAQFDRSGMTLQSASTPLYRYARFVLALSPAAVPANSTVSQAFTGAFLQAGDVILSVVKAAFQAGLLVTPGLVTGAGAFTLQFTNVTGAAISPTAAEQYAFVVVQ